MAHYAHSDTCDSLFLMCNITDQAFRISPEGSLLQNGMVF